MTDLTKPVTRRTPATVRDGGERRIVVTLHPKIIELRCEGLRDRVRIRYDDLYRQLIKQST